MLREENLLNVMKRHCSLCTLTAQKESLCTMINTKIADDAPRVGNRMKLRPLLIPDSGLIAFISRPSGT